jgi:hypothetical protein
MEEYDLLLDRNASSDGDGSSNSSMANPMQLQPELIVLSSSSSDIDGDEVQESDNSSVVNLISPVKECNTVHG